jgi:hypothetical protein
MICTKEELDKIANDRRIRKNLYRKMERARKAKEKAENITLRTLPVQMIRRSIPVKYLKCTGKGCTKMIPKKDLWCYECECKELNVKPQINLNYMGEQ